MRYRIPAYRVALVRDGSVTADGERPKAAAPASVARLFLETAEDDGREHFRVALLDIRHRVVGILTISMGTLTSSLVHPREVFAPAIVHKAAAIILTHNHPSGDPEPSTDDIALTRRLMAAGAVLGVEVLDHVITADGSMAWVSLKERGVL